MQQQTMSLRGAVALLIAALGLAACSSSASPSTGTSSSSPVVVSPSGSPSGSSSAASDAPLPPDPSASAGLESAPPLGQPACVASTLSVVDADAVTVGTSLEEVFVVRTSGADCQLSGYPQLTFTGGDGKPVPVQVDQGGHGLPASTPGPVTLSRTTSVSFGVATARSGGCQPTSKVQVTLPSITPSFLVTTSIQICMRSVGVTPVQRRSDSDGG